MTDLLRLLDRIDKYRRTHKDYNADHCMRAIEAIVAKEAGYESRGEWVGCLISDPDSIYRNDMDKLNI